MQIHQVMLLVFRSMQCDAVSVMTVRLPSASAVRITWRLALRREGFDVRREIRVPLAARPAGPLGHALFQPVLWSAGPGRADTMITMVTARSPERLTYVTLEATTSFDDVDCSLAGLLLPQLSDSDGLMHNRRPSPTVVLTERQVEILSNIRDGLTAEAVAHRCGISTRTAQKHLEHIYRKLGCHDKVTAVLTAERAGLLRAVVLRVALRDSA
jgi:DNA-binding CsgD family transcriptional regulator